MWRTALAWMRAHRILILLFVSGLIIRLALSLMEGSGDIHNHVTWAQDLIQNGAPGFYERPFRLRLGVIEPNYPPLSIILFTLLTFLYDACVWVIWQLNITIPFFPSSLVSYIQHPHALSTIMRLPAIAADLGIAMVVYAFIRRLRMSRQAAFAGVCGVLFNPAFFYNSAIWGQIESVPLFFVMSALYYLLYLNNDIGASLLLFGALMTKQTAIIFLPVFIVVYLRYYGVYKTARAACLLALFTFTIFLPFSSHSSLFIYPLVTYFTKILTASGLPYASNHAFNLWGMLTGFRNIADSDIFILGITYRVWGLGLTIALFIGSCYVLWKRKVSHGWIMYSCFIVSAGTFVLLTRMHERHLEMALPFLLIMAVRKSRYIGVFIYISAFHTLNLYHNRWQPAIPGFDVLFSNVVVVSVVTLLFLGLFLYLSYIYFRQGIGQKQGDDI
ncbi:MAG: hypothetical protein RI947_747 [Candidatus Parcubacteria bacterium]|jgi:Gpi18-like mannosyltransferase